MNEQEKQDAKMFYIIAMMMIITRKRHGKVRITGILRVLEQMTK